MLRLLLFVCLKMVLIVVEFFFSLLVLLRWLLLYWLSHIVDQT